MSLPLKGQKKAVRLKVGVRAKNALERSSPQCAPGGGAPLVLASGPLGLGGYLGSLGIFLRQYYDCLIPYVAWSTSGRRCGQVSALGISVKAPGCFVWSALAWSFAAISRLCDCVASMCSPC